MTPEIAKHNSRVVIFIAVASCLFGNVLARDQNGKHMTFSLGSESCGKMTEDVKKTIAGEAMYRSYIDGFLSAVNLLSLGEANFFEGTDSISRYKFVLKYCEENPLSPVVEAINKLVLRYKISLY